MQSNGQQPSRLEEVEPLTNREQLFLLIDAVERALVETVAMEVEISDFLRKQNLEPKIITSDGKQEILHDYRPEVVYPRKENADALKVRATIYATKLALATRQPSRDKQRKTAEPSHAPKGELKLHTP